MKESGTIINRNQRAIRKSPEQFHPIPQIQEIDLDINDQGPPGNKEQSCVNHSVPSFGVPLLQPLVPQPPPEKLKTTLIGRVIKTPSR